MSSDNRNFILAIALSVAVIAIWQVFYANPRIDEAQQQQQTQQQTQQQNGQQDGQQAPAPQPQTSQQQAPVPQSQQPDQTPAVNVPQPDAGPAIPGAAVQLPREARLEKSPRVPIETPKLTGSINLRGGQLDDLRLKDYHETVDKSSPIISLLSPAGADGAFFVDQGWLKPQGVDAKVPGTDTVWQVADGATLTPQTPLTLSWDNGEGLTFRKIFTVDENYMFTVRQEIENSTAQTVNLQPYARAQRQGVPEITGIYVLHEGLLSVLDQDLEEITYSDAQDNGAKGYSQSSVGGWVGITDKYWAAAIIPDQSVPFTGGLRHVGGANGADIFQAYYTLDAPLAISAGQTSGFDSMVFAGAKKSRLIDSYQAKLNITNFELMIDWGWFYFITKPLFWVLDLFNGWFGNFGVAIMAVTVLLKLLFFPLQNKSYASMSKMKKLAPEMENIKKRFPDDRMKQQQAIMEMYKKEEVSPLSGCWPILIQIPVFFALYKVIYVTIEMRHAPFILWIRDLSAPDPTSIFNLFGLLPYEVPTFLLIGVLPILMGVTMWIQMRLNPAPPDPIQAQIFNWMPLFFTFLLATFPAGLVLYWTWNNLLSIFQQAFIMKRHGVEIDLIGNIKNSLGLNKAKGDKAGD